MALPGILSENGNNSLQGRDTIPPEIPRQSLRHSGAVKKRIAIQRIFTHKKHRACPGKTDTLFLYVRAKNVLIFNDSVIARPSGRGDLLVKYANLRRSTRRLPRRFAARNDGVDDGWHLYPCKCIARICIRVSLQPLFSFFRGKIRKFGFPPCFFPCGRL